MKWLVSHLLLLLLFITPGVALAAEVIDFGTLPIESQQGGRQALTAQPIELNGPRGEVEFYYELPVDGTNANDFVQFDVTKSQLLVEPSSLTIKIDGDPVQTVALGTGPVERVNVPLTGAALTKGIHTISVVFEGLIKTGVCLPQKTSGNWLTIQPTSFLSLASVLPTTSGLDLSAYPEMYRGTTTSPTFVVMPTDASLDTLQSAHTIANYLSALSEPESVQVVYEEEVTSLRGNVILVGGSTEFQALWTKQVISHHRPAVNEGTLYLSQSQLRQANQQVTALIVTAMNPADILRSTDVLTQRPLIDQLADRTVQLTELPEVAQQQVTSEIPLTSFGLTDVMLDQQQTKTDAYFYYLPVDKQLLSAPSIELKMKRSDLLKPREGVLDEAALLEGDVELLVLINQIPHSVSMRDMVEDENGMITTSIPFDADIIGSNRLVSLQFDTHGLYTENPCMTTDQNKWIFLSSASKFVLPTTPRPHDIYFNSFPFPFAEKGSDVLLVTPKEGIANSELQAIFRVLTANNELPNIKIKVSNEVTEDDLATHHVLFLGGVEQHPVLTERSEELLVESVNGQPALGAEGFIESQVKYYTFMQASPWNEENYVVVFDGMNGSEGYFTPELLDFLQGTENPSTIAVQTGVDTFFTNTIQVEAIQSEEPVVEEEDTQLIWWVIGFFGLLVMTLGLILFFWRRRRT